MLSYMYLSSFSGPMSVMWVKAELLLSPIAYGPTSCASNGWCIAVYSLLLNFLIPACWDCVSFSKRIGRPLTCFSYSQFQVNHCWLFQSLIIPSWEVNFISPTITFLRSLQQNCFYWILSSSAFLLNPALIWRILLMDVCFGYYTKTKGVMD